MRVIKYRILYKRGFAIIQRKRGKWYKPWIRESVVLGGYAEASSAVTNMYQHHYKIEIELSKYRLVDFITVTSNL